MLLSATLLLPLFPSRDPSANGRIRFDSVLTLEYSLFAAPQALARTPRICVVARTYFAQPPEALLSLSSSLLASARDVARLRIVFVDTDRETPYPGLADVVRDIKTLLQADVAFSPVKYSSLGFFNFTETDFGYLITDLVMENLAPTCDAFLITNGDNIYSSAFFPALLPEILKGYDIVASNFVSRYNMSEEWVGRSLWQRNCGPRRPGLFQEFRTEFKRFCIDLGAALFNARLLSKSTLRFVLDELRNDAPRKRWRTHKHQDRDGIFFEKIVKFPGVNSTVLEESLFLHQ